MAQFIGSWKVDLKSYTNVDAFAKASGVSEEMVEKYKNMEYTVIYKKTGDLWSYDIIRDGTMPNQSYTFQSGVEVDTKNVMGKGIRFTVNFESDSKMTEIEYAETMGWKRVDITREVKGDVLDVTIKVKDDESMKDVESTFKFYKC